MPGPLGLHPRFRGHKEGDGRRKDAGCRQPCRRAVAGTALERAEVVGLGYALSLSHAGRRDLPPTVLSALSGGVHITAVGSPR